MNRSTTYKATLTAVLTALATLAFMLESLFPPLFLPGARMGVSNVFILLVAIIVGGRYAFISLIVKILIGSLFSGNISSVMYSLPSGIISLTIEIFIIYHVKNVSYLAISVLGSVINITIQNTVFCLVTQAIEYLSFLPYLASISVFSGLIIGIAVHFIVKFYSKKYKVVVNTQKEKKVEH